MQHEIDRDDLRTLISVARAGSLAGAAGALGSHRSTVLRRIERLEARLGLRLFDRTPQGLVLTAAGERVSPNAELMSDAVDEIRRSVEADHGRPAGHIRLLLTFNLAFGLLPCPIDRFRLAYPEIMVEVIGTLDGSVAKTIAEDGRTGINWIRSPLCGGIEKSGNEDRLSSDIASADLSNLPLPDHRHRFETCQCSSGGSEPAEAEPRSDQTLDAPMILLDNIIQILALPETRTAPEFAVSLHLRDRPWIGGVLVDRERARIDGVGLRERLAEEPLRRSRIAPC